MKLKKKVEKRAGDYDMTVAGYAKYLMIADIKSSKIPVMEPSESSMRALREAIREEKEGRLKEIGNIKDFFDSIGK